jgi:hypothetical protein
MASCSRFIAVNARHSASSTTPHSPYTSLQSDLRKRNIEFPRRRSHRKMAKKATAAGLAPALTKVDTASDATRRVGDVLEGSLATDPVPTVRVNKANLGEIKSAIDDIVKKVRRAALHVAQWCGWFYIALHSPQSSLLALLLPRRFDMVFLSATAICSVTHDSNYKLNLSLPPFFTQPSIYRSDIHLSFSPWALAYIHGDCHSSIQNQPYGSV